MASNIDEVEFSVEIIENCVPAKLNFMQQIVQRITKSYGY